ncbi:hypothetical protein G6O67_002129 [Ophiocordyceps sinensis]|uniref:Uncharacterized protein n=1 Tax=Ophiocordyceps sinensis TaxID=72228 RepID=A0A8H4PTU4_9HYPO|nr:hypothetical protein G6O67_002129 [Ophiocordyceps sinensis]
MNSLKVPESGLLLDGSSEGDDDFPPQAFFLSLSDDVVQNLVQSARNGEDLHLALGNAPTLHFGSHSHAIASPDDDVPYDLYLTKPFESSRKAERLPHTSSLFKKPKQPAPEQKKRTAKAAKYADQKTNGGPPSGKSSTSSALDSDMETLQNGMAAHEAGRERARVVEKLPASRKGADKAKGKFWSNYNSTPKSMPTSPALNNSVASPASTPALDASQQVMERKKEQRVILVHELAVRDRTTEYLRGKWAAKESEFRPTLEKMAELSPDSNKWAMKKTCWKELDVWKYDYGTREDRQTAIDNAVRQYDKQRLSSSEVEWQRLLSTEERGKGKCLSRLQANLAKGPAQQPAPKIKANGESMSRSSSNPLPAKSSKVTAPSAQVKRLLGNTKTKAAPQKPSPTKAKPVGKPSNGRVLSAAIIENSDSSGDEAPTQKAKPGTAKPKDTVIVKTRPLHRAPPVVKLQPPPPPPSRPAVKRSRDEDDSSSSSGTPLSKRIKPKQPPQPARSIKQRPPNPGPASRNAGAPSSLKSKKTSPTKSSPLASSPPTNASDLDEETPPAPSKKRKAENDSKPGATKRRVVESVPTDVLSKAHKFKAFYQKYEALHWEISALTDPPHEKLADLLDMRGRLQMMKKEIYKQYSPGRE